MDAYELGRKVVEDMERENRKGFERRVFRSSSVRFPEGGDTHFHPWRSGRGVTVTTRLRGGIEDHVPIRESSLFDEGEDLDGFRTLFDNR